MAIRSERRAARMGARRGLREPLHPSDKTLSDYPIDKQYEYFREIKGYTHEEAVREIMSRTGLSGSRIDIAVANAQDRIAERYVVAATYPVDLRSAKGYSANVVAHLVRRGMPKPEARKRVRWYRDEIINRWFKTGISAEYAAERLLERKRIYDRGPAAAGYAVKNERNQVKARARTKVAAHRASRKKKHAGTRVVTMTKMTTVARTTRNMAKLSSRGRSELARVSKETSTPDGNLTIWERNTVTLMSDRSILEKSDVRFKPDQYDPKGRLHSYGWKVKGKLKEGLDPQSFADIYAKRGFKVESIAGHGTLATYKKPKVKLPPTPKQAERRAIKEETKRRVLAETDGHGFYVINSTTDGAQMGPSGMYLPRAANHGPFATLDEALPAAWAQTQEYLQMKFTYLLPVEVIESPSKEAAERGEGYVWWTGGKRKGAPVPEEQTSLNMAGRDLHARIEAALGWRAGESYSFSMPSLRELVRPVSPKLVHEITQEIAGGPARPTIPIARRTA